MDRTRWVGGMFRYIFEALSKVNRTDVALRMLNVTEYPSFGYQITNQMEPATLQPGSSGPARNPEEGCTRLPACCLCFVCSVSRRCFDRMLRMKLQPGIRPFPVPRY